MCVQLCLYHYTELRDYGRSLKIIQALTRFSLSTLQSVSLNMSCATLLLILSLALVQASYNDPWVASKFPQRQAGPEMPTVTRNLLFLQGDCGDVCESSKEFPIRAGKYFDTMNKDIECDALFDSPYVDVPPHRVEEQQSIGAGVTR